MFTITVWYSDRITFQFYSCRIFRFAFTHSIEPALFHRIRCTVRVKNMLKHGIVILQSRTIGNTDLYHILSPSPKNAHMSIEQYSYEQL